MQDRLEKIIQENREAFDDHFPPEDIWEGIDTHLSTTSARKGKIVKLVRFFVAASVAVMLLGAGAWGGMQYAQDKAADKLFAVQAEYDAFLDAEQKYIRHINLQLGKLQGTEAVEKIEDDLKELENNFLELKEQLSNSDDHTVVLQEMIRNYRTRIGLLEHVIRESRENPNDKEI